MATFILDPNSQEQTMALLKAQCPSEFKFLDPSINTLPLLLSTIVAPYATTANVSGYNHPNNFNPLRVIRDRMIAILPSNCYCAQESYCDPQGQVFTSNLSKFVFFFDKTMEPQ